MMSNINTHRRRFLQSAFYSSLVLGSTGSLLTNPSYAAPQPLNSRLLANLYLNGGPDMRHLIVPAFDDTPGTFGTNYWNNRMRAHRIGAFSLNGVTQTAQQRWEDDYFHITVGGQNWNGNLVDAGGLNSGTEFGIWKEAGWLIDMFLSGNVALIFNAGGDTNRAHDLATLQLEQGDVSSGLSQRNRSGWGGRLARVAGGNAISLTNSPRPFTFGPIGAAPRFNLEGIDNTDLLSISNARELGLFNFDLNSEQFNNRDDIMARAAGSYYAALRSEQIPTVYDKFLAHESTVREFGNRIQEELEDIEVPLLIEALGRGVNGPSGPINPEPNPASGNFGNSRRVLRSQGFALQIRNFYDTVVTNSIFDGRVMSLEYGGWDSHGSQRRVPQNFSSDPNSPNEDRGIESGLRDIFGGQFGNNPSNADALHGGFSALWASLPSNSRQNIALTIAGEFGRQIRDNGDAGTDHGSGNLMFVIGERSQGGVYGEIFPESEIPKYEDSRLRTPDIDRRTEFDHFFASVCDWVSPNSGRIVFPRTAPGFNGDAPIIEQAGLFNNLLS